MSDPPKPKFQTMMAGASLAFGLPFLIIEVISALITQEFYNQNSLLLGLVYITSYVVGGMVGGALVARKVEMKYIIRAGGITGFMAFLLQQIISFIFYGAGVVGDTYPLFALLGGSLAGSMYTRQARKRIIEEQDIVPDSEDANHG